MKEQNHLTPSADTLRALRAMLLATGDGRSPAQVIDLAVRAWLAGAARAQPAAAACAARGYQWKSLFLPDGTMLRMVLDGVPHIAHVRGDFILYQGQRFSPRQLVMHLAGSVRNAWLALWLRCPGDLRWHLADTRRRILRREAAPGRPLPARPPAAAPAGDPALAARAAAVQRALAPSQALRVRRRQACLQRGDAVRDDQPDLTRPGGAGPYGAGRRGPRDRRLAPAAPRQGAG